MPREQINYPNLELKADQQRIRDAALKEDPDTPMSEFGPWNESSVHVSWQPGGVQALYEEDGQGGASLTNQAYNGHVQLGFEADLEYVKMAMSSPNGARSDRTVLWTDILSPGDIDRLIKILKKAQRKAFPSQE